MKRTALLLILFTQTAGAACFSNLKIYERVATLVANKKCLNLVTDDKTDKLKEVSEFLYTRFKDEFDFIFLVYNNDEKPRDLPYGINYYVQNKVSGIGKPKLDQAWEWGSAGRLKGFILFTFRGSVENGPALHEIAHTWGNALSGEGAEGHWGFSSPVGQLGGFKQSTLKSLGGGKYQANSGVKGKNTFGLTANWGNTIPYSTMELYLMGMLPAKDVEDVQIALNPQWVNDKKGIFKADGFKTVKIQEIVDHFGPREPSVENSQKSFRVLTVLISNSSVSGKQLGEVDRGIKWLAHPGPDNDPSFNFFEATRGVGRLTVSLDETQRDK